MSVTIRRATTQDAAAFARILGDPAVYPGLMQLPHTSEELWRARLAEVCTPESPDLMLVAELDGRVAGSAGLHPAAKSPRRRHAMRLGLSVAPDSQRRGVGRALLAAICDYADRWAGVLRLELDVYADNAPALALYREFGFVVEGRHPAYALRDGVYVESLSMARLHPRPPSLPSAAAPPPT